MVIKLALVIALAGSLQQANQVPAVKLNVGQASESDPLTIQANINKLSPFHNIYPDGYLDPVSRESGQGCELSCSI